MTLDSGSGGSSSARHQLIVLTVVSGDHFPPDPEPDSEVIIRGELSGVVLMTDPIILKSTSPHLEEQQLVWEVTQPQLRQFRSRKVLLRVEILLNKEVLSHLVLDLRTAQPMKSEADLPEIKTHKTVGSQLTLDLALALEDTDHDSSEAPSISDNILMLSHTDKDSDSLSPTLVEDSEDGEGGYFLIGSKSSATERFSLSVSLVSAQHLSLSVKPNTVYHDQYYWQYNLLGVDISSEQFSDLAADTSFVSEKATAIIKTSMETLTRFLSQASVSVKLCNGSSVVAAADLPLQCLVTTGGEEMSVSRSVELVSGHNLNIGEDSEGNKPTLRINLSLVKTSSPVKTQIFLAADDEVTTGRLSDSEMDVEHEEENYDKEERHQTVVKSPEKSSRSMEDESSVATTPKKLKLSASNTFLPINSTVSPRLDTTDYLKMPVVKPSAEKTLTAPRKTLNTSSKHHKLSIELCQLKMVKNDFFDKTGVLAYKYLALYKDAIKTDAFKLIPNSLISIPKGYCQFSFCVNREKMLTTFRDHLLKVGLYADNQMIGVADINLLKVVDEEVIKEKVHVLDRHSGDILGFLDVELKLTDGEDSVVESAQFKDESSLNISKDILYHAAKELEAWKMNQKKKFNENLLQIEAQHLNMLGQEWKEREIEREKTIQEKMNVMKGLEDELRKELEKIECERKELEEKTKTLQIEKDNVEAEKRNLKTQKIAMVDRLKQQVKERDAQLNMKDTEIEMLSKRVKLLEVESRRPPPRSTRNSSTEKSKKEEELRVELMALKEEKLAWSTRLEQSQKETEWYKLSCEELKQEINSLKVEKEKLYSEQISGLERQVRQLSSEKSLSVENNLHPQSYSKKIDVHVQTSQRRLGDEDDLDEDEETVTMDGLLRMEEHLAMLLRTGVYTSEDHIVIKLREQIRKIRRKIEAEKDK